MARAEGGAPHHVPQRVSAAQQRLIAVFERRMMSVLLVLLVLLVFAVPAVATDRFSGHLLIDAMLTCILVVGTLAVSGNRRMMIGLGLCSLVALGLRWSEWIVPETFLPAVRDLSVMLSLGVMSVAVGIRVFGTSGDITDRVVGAIVLYLLIGSIYAVAYLVVADANPLAFNPLPPTDVPMARWVYFSFVTLTTVGYGDITPLARLPRSMAILEALIGQLYPAIILARLVALPREE